MVVYATAMIEVSGPQVLRSKDSYRVLSVINIYLLNYYLEIKGEAYLSRVDRFM